MRKMRNLHLWIGLISSIFLLVEAVTGLLLSEPWLIGQTERGEMHRAMQEGGTFRAGQASDGGAAAAPVAPRAEGGRDVAWNVHPPAARRANRLARHPLGGRSCRSGDDHFNGDGHLLVDSHARSWAQAEAKADARRAGDGLIGKSSDAILERWNGTCSSTIVWRKWKSGGKDRLVFV